MISNTFPDDFCQVRPFFCCSMRILCFKALCFAGIMLLPPDSVNAQDVRLGVFYSTGNSSGRDNSPSLTNAIEDYRNGFVQFGIYGVINYRPDSTQSFFRYIRTDLGVTSRTGTFDLGNANLARITTNSIDLTALLPMSFMTSKEIEGYAAVGLVISYQYKRTVIATQIAPPVDMNSINPGVAFELGFKWGGSFIGYRTMLQFNDYPCRVGTLTLGFCPLPIKRSK